MKVRKKDSTMGAEYPLNFMGFFPSALRSELLAKMSDAPSSRRCFQRCT